MNNAQVFQLFGIIYCSLGIGAVINDNFYEDIFNGFGENLSLAYINGFFAVIAGYLLITFYNVWALELPIIITILGWMALFKGIVLLIAPKKMLGFTRNIMKNKKFLAMHRVMILIMGIGFLYIGYFVL